MLTVILQIWGGLFYLLNKILFSRSERSNNKQRKRLWHISAWVFYLFGVPAWVIIFVIERNWIAAAIEAGGIPAMFIGISVAMRGHGHQPKWLDYLAKLIAGLGLAVSLYDFGGITTVNQVLELGIASGYLFGTYLLAKEKPNGYLWLMVMNSSTATLMSIQNYPLLMLQQVLSLGFVIDAYWVQRWKSKSVRNTEEAIN